MTSPVIAYINTRALLHNLNVAKQHAKHSKVLAMVKANAYGHGFKNVIPVLHDHVDALAVARLDEALKLRSMHVTKPIVIMAGFYLPEQLAMMSASNLEPVVHTNLQIDILEQIKLDTPVNIWLKVDTGMGRLGFLPKNLHAAYQRLKACKNVAKITVLTHFLDAGDLKRSTTDKQIELFNEITRDLATEKSLAKSAGILEFPESCADWIRPGVMLYGASSIDNKTAAELDLQPVMTLKAPVISVKELPKGSTVSYGGLFTCPEDMPVAVVGVGYGDGYPRSIQQGTPVLINGKRLPVIGRVCMDMIMVDLRQCPDVKIGTQATLWGEGLPSNEIATYAGTTPYELFCGVSKRVKFEIIN